MEKKQFYQEVNKSVRFLQQQEEGLEAQEYFEMFVNNLAEWLSLGKKEIDLSLNKEKVEKPKRKRKVN